MLQAFINIFKVVELRNRVLFTLGMLMIYRLGYWIPLAGIDQSELIALMDKQSKGTALGDLSQFIQVFTGGSLGQSTVFGMGILPYISAGIIFQLLTTVVDGLKQMQKEGPAGRQKIQEYTRYATFALCLIQSTFYLSFFQSQNLVYPSFHGTVTYWVAGVMGMTTGTMFLMWLGEQIDKYGIGNGASMIICAGIISRMPAAIGWVYSNFSVSAGDAARNMTPMKVLLLLAAFLIVISGTILITQGQRRITVQQAKHTRGRKVYGGQRSYLPLRVNHGGVMPIIFASSLLMFPTMILPWFSGIFDKTPVLGTFFHFLRNEFSMTGGYSFLYLMAEVSLIYFFAYFWTSVQFQPNEMADQLRDHGSFIPGLRPGPRTAEYLEKVMERITYVGAGFLAAIAVAPTIVTSAFSIPFQVSSFLGGTGLLITVSVALDLIQRVEANLLMRNYKGFLGGGGPDGGGRGPRIRGPRSS